MLDYVGYHRKATILAYAHAHGIRFYWTPIGASWLNRIDCHFTALRKFALDNTDYQNHDEQQAAIQRYLAWRNGRRNISLQPRNHWPKTPCRRKMRRCFDRKVYGHCWHVECSISQHIRRLDPALLSRGDKSRKAEVLLRVLTHNLMIIRRPAAGIQQDNVNSYIQPIYNARKTKNGTEASPEFNG